MKMNDRPKNSTATTSDEGKTTLALDGRKMRVGELRKLLAQRWGVGNERLKAPKRELLALLAELQAPPGPSTVLAGHDGKTVQEVILHGIGECLPVELAARRVGIPPELLQKWLEKGGSPDSLDAEFAAFAAAVSTANVDIEAELVKTVAAAAKDGDVKAAQWLLERRNPENWVRQSVSRVMPPAPRSETAAAVPGDEFADMDNVCQLPAR
jgi:hypothetical protein